MFLLDKFHLSQQHVWLVILLTFNFNLENFSIKIDTQQQIFTIWDAGLLDGVQQVLDQTQVIECQFIHIFLFNLKFQISSINSNTRGCTTYWSNHLPNTIKNNQTWNRIYFGYKFFHVCRQVLKKNSKRWKLSLLCRWRSRKR